MLSRNAINQNNLNNINNINDIIVSKRKRRSTKSIYSENYYYNEFENNLFNDKFDNNNSNNTNSNNSNIQPNIISDDSNNNCIICSWVYPSIMSNDEKNAHVNFCLEGKGEVHKNNYLSSMKLLKITVEKSNVRIADNNNKNEIGNLLDNNENKLCPFCNKYINRLNNREFEESHMLNCYTKMEKEMLLQNKRKRNSY